MITKEKFQNMSRELALAALMIKTAVELETPDDKGRIPVPKAVMLAIIQNYAANAELFNELSEQFPSDKPAEGNGGKPRWSDN